ncbi:type II toxin-antitoxin system RelB/DinJ family antitoxin [Lactiplantibacillus garii]|uniref:Type II toxin-antitoxin system RelB/DinJ family antitoxin n=1 Tax=Lactiplantibacillus garii TaxID=2306423 RepID=A0A426D5G8_9LACO|nr:type II toxin-antitoxin system RelB/DinJ family antitoxin [Lactiplantibacillus garii]RRK09854.1 type II toxin-antitoxin system RelB/DinJ family antitoxin [Lactiplantibacillus garii]
MPAEVQKKTASVFTRVTPELKSQAEAVLDQLQIPMSTALNMFLQQVVNQGGIPFDVKLAPQKINTDQLSKEQFSHEIQKGLDDFSSGHTYTAEQIRQEFDGKK